MHMIVKTIPHTENYKNLCMQRGTRTRACKSLLHFWRTVSHWSSVSFVQKHGGHFPKQHTSFTCKIV